MLIFSEKSCMFVYYPSGAQDNQDLWVFVFDFTGPKRDTSQQVIILPLNYIKCVLFVPGLIRALFVLQRVKPSLNYNPSQHQALSQIIVKYDSDILRGKGIRTTNPIFVPWYQAPLHFMLPRGVLHGHQHSIHKSI